MHLFIEALWFTEFLCLITYQSNISPSHMNFLFFPFFSLTYEPSKLWSTFIKCHFLWSNENKTTWNKTNSKGAGVNQQEIYLPYKCVISFLVSPENTMCTTHWSYKRMYGPCSTLLRCVSNVPRNATHVYTGTTAKVCFPLATSAEYARL